MSDRRFGKAWLLAASSALCLGLLELCFSLISLLLPEGFDYVPPTPREFDAYLAQAEASKTIRSGWLPDPVNLSAAGYRLSPAGERYTEPCLSLYGDSFAWGHRVSDSEAWGNRLSELAGCRVDNYGVPGYGTDQAYLHFLDTRGDRAPIVILTVWAENIARNVNQDRSMIYAGFNLKPRFILDATGQLELVPRPQLSVQDYEGFVADPEAYLKHEYFMPDRTLLSKRRLGFPYLMRLPYYFSYKRIYMSVLSLAFDVPSWYAELYEPAHPSTALPITTEILVAYSREARARGRTPLVFLLPSIRDADHRRSAGQWVYAPLLDALRKRNVTVFDAGEEMVKRMGDEDFCLYMCLEKEGRSGHYTVRGNALLADVAYDILAGEGLLTSVEK